MLYSPDDTENEITEVPHPHEFTAARRRLTDEQYAAIVAELNRRIEGSEVRTSSWMPGADWTGTVFEPIYEVARAKR